MQPPRAVHMLWQELNSLSHSAGSTIKANGAGPQSCAWYMVVAWLFSLPLKSDLLLIAFQKDKKGCLMCESALTVKTYLIGAETVMCQILTVTVLRSKDFIQHCLHVFFSTIRFENVFLLSWQTTRCRLFCRVCWIWTHIKIFIGIWTAGHVGEGAPEFCKIF